MDTVLFVETLTYILVAICAVLTALAVIFLVVRPLLDPHWRDAYGEAADRDAVAERQVHEPDGMMGT